MIWSTKLYIIVSFVVVFYRTLQFSKFFQFFKYRTISSCSHKAINFMTPFMILYFLRLADIGVIFISHFRIFFLISSIYSEEFKNCRSKIVVVFLFNSIVVWDKKGNSNRILYNDYWKWENHPKKENSIPYNLFFNCLYWLK